jgi:hypothetical protein
LFCFWDLHGFLAWFCSLFPFLIVLTNSVTL